MSYPLVLEAMISPAALVWSSLLSMVGIGTSLIWFGRTSLNYWVVGSSFLVFPLVLLLKSLILRII